MYFALIIVEKGWFNTNAPCPKCSILSEIKKFSYGLKNILKIKLLPPPSLYNRTNYDMVAFETGNIIDLSLF